MCVCTYAHTYVRTYICYIRMWPFSTFVFAENDTVCFCLHSSPCLVQRKFAHNVESRLVYIRTCEYTLTYSENWFRLYTYIFTYIHTYVCTYVYVNQCY